jgi:uncharacterized membrane protein
MQYTEDVFKKLERDVVEVEQQILGEVRRVRHFRREHPPVRDVNQEFQDSFSPLERLALFVTDHVGTFGFFLIILAWTIVWLGWNTLGPASLRFDPAPAFVFWLFISNMIQIMLMPLIMVGQNLASRHAEIRAQSDFEINQKAEKEVEVILLHVEQQTAQIERQGELIVEILKRLSMPQTAPPHQGQAAEGETAPGG